MTDTPLAPCPFCGKKPELIKSTIKNIEDGVRCANEYCPLWDSMSVSEWQTRPLSSPEADYEKRIADLRNIKEVQCSKGNYDQGEYMRGLANGLIMALSIMERNEPKFFDPPMKVEAVYGGE
jgi:hypothetical protein